MSSLLLNRGRRLMYISGVYASLSLSFFSSSDSSSTSTPPPTSSSPFANYLDKSYDSFEERFEQNNDTANHCKILSEFECRKLFSMPDAIRIQSEAFVSMHTQQTIVPQRIILSLPNSANEDTLFKPSVNNDVMGQKVVSVRPNNPSLHSLPMITGSIMLWNRETGLTNCLMDASFITGRRTAAGSGLATDLFASATLNVLTVFGAGTQALEHIRAVLTVRGLPHTIFVINRNLSKADKLKQVLLKEIKGTVDIVTISLEEFEKNRNGKYSAVISEADVICTCTSSDSALFDGNLLKSSVHINAVGSYKPSMIELDENVIRQCYIFVDSKHAFHSGDLYHYFNIEKDSKDLDKVYELEQIKWREIGEYIANDIGAEGLNEKKEFGKPIHVKYEKERTLFKSVGVAAQDLHSAYFVYQQAVNHNIGNDVYL